MTPENIEICLPTSWRRRLPAAHGVLLSARATVLPASGVPPEATVRCVAVDTDLRSWRVAATDELAERLVDFELEDVDEFELQGRAVVYQRFAHRLGAADVLSDQWAWLADGLGVTLTCSVARADYADFCDVFEAIAETISIDPQAA
jgi:hypothetical protein